MPFVEVGPDRVERLWEPNARQKEFIQIPFSIFEALYGGAAFGGKSELLVMLPIVYQWYKNPRFKGIIFRRTFPQLEESLIPRSKEYYEAVGGTYNSQQHLWTFPSGATIRFSYMLRKDDARSHDTAEYNYVAFDELTHFDEFQYVYITSRVRSSDPSLPAIVRSASNPGNVGHRWVRKRFIEPARKGYVKLFDRKAQSYRIFIPARATDNAAGIANDPGYINRLWLLPDAERKAKLDGDWWAYIGTVFNEWRSEHGEGEPDHALHVIKPFDIPLWWPRIVAIDWGYRAMTWIGWAAISPDQRAYLYREYAKRGKKVSEWASEFSAITAAHNETLTSIVIDPSAKQMRGDPMTILAQFAEHSGYKYDETGRFGQVRLADNDRISGKLALHEYLRWEAKPKRIVPKEGYNHELAQTIYRKYGEKAWNDYCMLFVPEAEETNIPKLQVFETCEEFCTCIPSIEYDEEKDGNVEDIKDFDGDDPYDGGRYLVKEIDRFLDTGEEAAKSRLVRDAVIREYQESGDMNRFYNRMAKVERDEMVNSGPVKMYHKRSRGSSRRPW
jgi:hypothetical protein